MTIKFSLKTQAFYDENSSVIPGDAINIPVDKHMQLIAGMNDGERRVFSVSNGEWTLSDRKPSQWHTWNNDDNMWVISDDSRIQIAKSEKSRRIQAANDLINSQQWPGKSALGRLNDDSLTRFNLWLDYLDILETMDISLSMDIKWPIKPE